LIHTLRFPDGHHVERVAPSNDDAIHAQQHFLERLLLLIAVDEHSLYEGFHVELFACLVPAHNAVGRIS